jgi:subtilisin
MFRQISTLIFCAYLANHVSIIETVEYTGSNETDVLGETPVNRRLASIKDLKRDIQENEEKILSRLELLNVPRSLGSEVVVAVFDTGIDITDKELMSKLYRKNGQIVYKDFTHSEFEPSLYDLHGHGTNVAKIITTINPQARILPVKVHDGYNNSLYNYTPAIQWLMRNHPEVKLVNVSMAGPSRSKEELLAFLTAKEAGITFVFAAGNLGRDIGIKHEFPASYSINDDFIVIGAMSDNHKRMESSNFGSGVVDFLAHGENFGFYSGTEYINLSGTSQATAVMTGAISQILSHNPDQTPDSIKFKLQKYSSKNGTAISKYGEVAYGSLIMDLIAHKYAPRNLASR